SAGGLALGRRGVTCSILPASTTWGGHLRDRPHGIVVAQTNQQIHATPVRNQSLKQREGRAVPRPRPWNRKVTRMDLNRVTEKVQEALASAQRKAASGGQQNIDVIHLLVSLLEQEPGLAVSVLRKAGIDVGGLQQRAEQELGRLPKVTGVSGGPEQ